MLAVALLLPAAAPAATVTAPDPRDQRPSLQPGAGVPDVRAVTASYDGGGTVAVTFTFEEPLAPGRGVPASASLRVSASPPDDDRWGDVFCSGRSQGDASLTSADLAAEGGTGALTVEGYSGSVPAGQAVSADRRSVTLTASAPALAGARFVCVEAFAGTDGGDEDPDTVDDFVAHAYFPGAPRTIPRMTRIEAVERTTRMLRRRLRMPDYLIRFVTCRRLSRTRHRCRWLAGGDTAAFAGAGTIGYTRLDARNLPHGRYDYRVRRIRIVVRGARARTVVTRRFRLRGAVSPVRG